MQISNRMNWYIVQERDIQIQRLGSQLRERLQQKDEIIQQKNADISTLQREVQRLQVRGDKDINFIRNFK